MPDFVADVDGAAIHLLNESEDRPEGRIAAAEIGSRAGRVLSILSYLRDEDDEGFRLNYIVKTGLTGQAVLQERLQRHLSRCGLEQVRFPYLVPASHTRFAILGRKGYRRVRRHIVRPTAATMLTSSELRNHFYDPLRIIRNGNALYFATDTVRQFKELINTAILGRGSEERAGREGSPWEEGVGFRFVFVDLAAIQLPPWDKPGAEEARVPGALPLTEAIQELDDRARSGDCLAKRTRLTVIVSGTDTAYSDDELLDLFRELRLRDGKDAIVLYRASMGEAGRRGARGDANVAWCDGGNVEEIRIDVNPTRPDAREAFVAGMVLHRAVASAWCTIPRKERLPFTLDWEHGWTKDLFPDPYDPCGEGAPIGYWESIDDEQRFLDENWPFREAVRFGKALANLWSRRPSRDLPDRRALLLVNLETGAPARDRGACTDPVGLSEKSPRDWYKEMTKIEAECCPGVGTSEQWRVWKERLWSLVSRQDLTKHPEDWGKRSRVLRRASWDTVRAMIALRTARRLSYGLRSRFKCIEKENAAYLTDLDGTLLQSSGLRSVCLKSAFLGLLLSREEAERLRETFPVLPQRVNVRDGDASETVEEAFPLMQVLDDCNRLYHALVYKQAAVWKTILDRYPYYEYGSSPRDFRQVWNHRLSYPVFLWALRWLSEGTGRSPDPGPPAGIVIKALGSEEIRQMLSMDEDGMIRDARTRLKREFDIKERDDGTFVFTEDEPRLDEWFREIANLETKHKRYFEEAARRFWSVDYEPLRHTRECLSTWRDVLGVRLYVATEGHHDTQVRKVGVLGLERFFPEGRIMSTEAGARSHEDLRNVRDAIEKRAEFRRYYTFMLSSIGKAADDVALPVQEEMNRLDTEMRHLRLYEEQWMAFAKKEPGYIYPLIVASVMAEADSPLVAFTDLGYLINKIESDAERVSRTYFAMVGDRESKDIAPIIKICGHASGPQSRDRVVTVRLLTLDHQNEDVDWTADLRTAPQYVAWTPIEALLSIAREEVWSEPLDYHTIPAILAGRLCDRTSRLDESWLKALAWGQEDHDPPLDQGLKKSLSRVSFLVLKSTIRDEEIDTRGFVEAVLREVVEVRKRGDWSTYNFIVDVIIGHVAFETAYMPQQRRGDMPELLRDAVCDESVRGFGGDQDPGQPRCVDEAFRALHSLADYPSLGQRTQCRPPDHQCQEQMLRCLVSVAVGIEERKFFRRWKARCAGCRSCRGGCPVEPE